jgi:hypothetical protein
MVGSSGQYAADSSRGRLVVMMLKAYWSALKHLPEMWESRRRVREFARISSTDFSALIKKHRITLKALTLGS